MLHLSLRAVAFGRARGPYEPQDRGSLEAGAAPMPYDGHSGIPKARCDAGAKHFSNAELACDAEPPGLADAHRRDIACAPCSSGASASPPPASRRPSLNTHWRVARAKKHVRRQTGRSASTTAHPQAAAVDAPQPRDELPGGKGALDVHELLGRTSIRLHSGAKLVDRPTRDATCRVDRSPVSLRRSDTSR